LFSRNRRDARRIGKAQDKLVRLEDEEKHETVMAS
jgi:hypothetical protein